MNLKQTSQLQDESQHYKLVFKAKKKKYENRTKRQRYRSV